MSSMLPSRRTGVATSESGFILGIVLVFLVVLSISATLGSSLVRTDLQIVNNLRSEKRAFFIAEAGISEALLRLEMPDPTTLVVDGATFNAALRPDKADPAWTANLLFGITSVSKTGSVVSAPTIQPLATRLAYSATTAGPDALRVEFDRCTAVGVGCTAVGAIRTASGKPVVRITSTGRSGVSRRTVTVLGTHDAGGASFVVLGDISKAVSTSGSGSLNLSPATLHVNSSYSDAVNTSGSSGIAAAAINIKGNCSGTCNINPSPNTNIPPIPDPLLHLQAMEPARPGSLPVRSDAGAALLPGYYPNGITVSSTAKTVDPGLYVLAPGKKLTVSGGGSITETAPGVTFFGDEFVISGGSALNLTAPKNGTHKGILLWQAVASTKKMVFSGGSVGTVDGAIYVPNAKLELSGGSGGMKLEFVIHQLTVSGASTIGQVTTPVVGGGPDYSILAWSDF